MKILVKYHSNDIDELQQIEVGNWIDLRIAEPMHMHAGEIALISTGVSIELPAGYEALVVPRSSTCLKYGLFMANSFAVIDTTYCGDNDVWKNIWYATRDVDIPINTRLSQFRIIETMPKIDIVKVDHLGNMDRGGYGSTGTDAFAPRFDDPGK